MSKITRKRLLRLSAKVLGILFLCWLINFVFLGYTVEVFHSQRLINAKAIWVESEPKNYQYTIRVSQYHIYFGAFLIKVIDGQIADIRAQRNSFIPSSAFEPIDDIARHDPESMEILPRQIVDYTINNLFSVAEVHLKDLPLIHITNCGVGQYRVEFDPEFAYISHFEADQFAPNAYSLHLFCPATHWSGEHFTISDFEILTP
jgi:hypothetical protein